MSVVTNKVDMGGAVWGKRNENETNKMHINKTKKLILYVYKIIVLK